MLSGVSEHAWRGARRLGGGPVTGAGPVCRGPVTFEYLWRVARAHRVVLRRGAREAWILHPTGRVDCFGAEGLLTASRIVPDWTQSILAIAGQRSQALAHGASQTLDHPLDLLVR